MLKKHTIGRLSSFICVTSLLTVLLVLVSIGNSSTANDQSKTAPTDNPIAKLSSSVDREQAVDEILDRRKIETEQLIAIVGSKKASNETRQAAAFLLGEMRSVKAIPVLSTSLAETFDKPYSIDISRYDASTINALLKIGRPAIPALVENIESHEPDSAASIDSLLLLRNILGDHRSVKEKLTSQRTKAKDETVGRRIQKALERLETFVN